MKKTKLVICLLFILSVVFLTSCCDHLWEDANCNSPKKCRECGITQGSVEHKYVSEGCLEPRVCKICGDTAKATGHTWNEATCIYPKACSSCEAIEGNPLGHTTKKGKCSRCKKDIDELKYNKGYAIVTYEDTIWMKELDDFTDIYLVGTIQSISKTNEFVLVDSTGGTWTVGVGTGCDIYKYEGTTCEVYGFSSGGISSQCGTPFVNMTRDDSHVIFNDGKTLYPERYSSTSQFPSKVSGQTSSTVWVTKNGSKFHTTSTCSGMKNAESMTVSQAQAKGYTACDKCR